MRITENASVSSSDEGEGESLELMRSIKEETAAFAPAIEALGRQIAAIQKRANRRSLLTDAVRFRSEMVGNWYGAEEATVADFVRKVLEEGIVKTDLESRSLWLQPGVAEALGLPFGERIGFFEFLRGLPGWLEI